MAAGQEATYYASQNQPVEAFFEGSDSLVKKSVKEEKIAINLAGAYAVECGVAALIAQKGGTPAGWFEKIIDGSIDSSDMKMSGACLPSILPKCALARHRLRAMSLTRKARSW